MNRRIFTWLVPLLVLFACGSLWLPTAVERPQLYAADAAHDDGNPEASGADSAPAHGENGHANANINPLSVDPDLAIVTLIIFAVMLAILAKFAWGPICKALDDRENWVAKQLDEARLRNEEAERLLGQHEQKLTGAADEVRGLLDQARKDADRQKQAILDEARDAARAEKERALREIGAAKNAALAELADKSVGTAVDLAGRIVGRQLNRDDHENLIQEALDQFPNRN